MQHLFDAWDKVAHRLKSAEHVLLLVDFDGTLTPIVDRPELTVLPAETKGLLRALVRNPRYTVGIVSGRALADLKDKVNVEGIIYAGNHGLEIEGFGSSFLEPVAEEMRPFLHMLYRALSATLRGIKGAFVEDKGLTLSVHYRSVDDAGEREVRDAFAKVTDPLNVTGRIKITQGKKVYEIRPPVDWDKGKAVAWFIANCKQVRGRGWALPLYLGDDLTDEDGFKSIEKNSGISVFVGERSFPSVARYFLNSPDEVTELLRVL